MEGQPHEEYAMSTFEGRSVLVTGGGTTLTG
jgi:hypothetical protein